MNQFDNTPMMNNGAPGTSGWIQTWIKAISQPNEQTFIDISESPDAQPKTAYIWVFIAGTVVYFISAVVQSIIMMVSGGNGDAASMLGGALIAVVCLSPVIGGLAVLFFALWTAIIQWVAKLFNGAGNYDKMLYTFAAIYVPISVISALITPFSAIPFVGICTGLISMGIGFYSLFLNITAVKAVNRFGWGEAAGSVLLPGVIFLFVCGCVVVASLMVMGPIIGNVFNDINQGLQFAP